MVRLLLKDTCACSQHSCSTFCLETGFSAQQIHAPLVFPGTINMDEDWGDWMTPIGHGNSWREAWASNEFCMINWSLLCFVYPMSF